MPPSRCLPFTVRFFEREGDLIYRGLVDGFRGTQYGGPPPCAPGEAPAAASASIAPLATCERCSPALSHAATALGNATHRQPHGHPPSPAGAPTSELLAGVQRILDIYVEEGYCLKATLTPGGGTGGATVGTGGGATFTVKLDGPANLWSLQVGIKWGLCCQRPGLCTLAAD